MYQLPQAVKIYIECFSFQFSLYSYSRANILCDGNVTSKHVKKEERREQMTVGEDSGVRGGDQESPCKEKDA